MDENGCRYSFRSDAEADSIVQNIIIIEKTIIMKKPTNGELKKKQRHLISMSPTKDSREKIVSLPTFVEIFPESPDAPDGAIA